MIVIELYELKNLCAEMAELGAANYAKRITPAKDLISQREAYREFQECRVKKWVQKGLITTTRGGASIRSKVLYSRADLMAVEKAEKLNCIINKL
jgi:hypothetical protein